MTDRLVVIRDNQEVPAEDFMRIQEFARSGVDELLYHTLTAGRAYRGFYARRGVGPYDLEADPGLYFELGRMYALREKSLFELSSHQPATGNVYVALCAWGTEAETMPVARDILIDVDSQSVESQNVNLSRERQATLAIIAGVPSGDPQRPSIQQDRIAVAYILLSPTGIEEITMEPSTTVLSQAELGQGLGSLQAWQEAAEPQIATIATQVSNLANGQGGAASLTDIFNLAKDVARLKEGAGLPDDYADYGADWFLTEDESDTENLEYLAKVEEGVRFSDENNGVSELALFSAYEARVKVDAGLMLPAYDSVLRYRLGNHAGDVAITQFTQTSFDMVQRSISRSRTRWGQTYKYCTNSRWWREGTYDPATGIFTRRGETFQVVSGDPTRNHKWLRLHQFWHDEWEETYWEKVTNTIRIDGAQISYPILNAQAGWLTGVDLYFTERGTSGDVHVVICGTTPSGTPDLSNVIASKTVPYLDLKRYPDETTVALTPTYLDSGQRYHIVLTTQGNHRVALSDGNEMAGAIMYSLDGAYFQADFTKDLMHGLRFAKFKSARTVVDMQPLNLDGGIAAIDILAGGKTPAACSLTYQVDVPGKGWTPLNEISVNALVGLPPLLPLQVVMQGTADLQPGLELVGSQVSLSRPRTTFRHISTPRVLAAASDTVTVEWLLGGWNDSHHQMSALIRANGADEAPDVTEDTPRAGGQLLRRMTFNLDAPTASFQIIADGSTSTALDVFLIEERTDVEL